MLFISVEDFFNRVAKLTRMTREEEKCCARNMMQGDADARKKLIQNYLPYVASRVRKSPKDLQTLQTVYCCIAVLEKDVDSFDFLQDNESFAHHISWRLRQCIFRCLSEQGHPY